MSLGLRNLNFGIWRTENISKLIKGKRGQFFILVAVIYCVILLTVATYVVSVISSPPRARIGEVQYVAMNIKGQSIRLVEVSLANVTNGGPADSLVLNLEDWKNSTESFCTQQGCSLALAYADVWNGTSWNETLSWSKARVSFSIFLQSGASEIFDEYTVRTELYVNVLGVESFNSTHRRVDVEVWEEGGAPVVLGTVLVNGFDASNNGDGTYSAVVPSSSEYIVSVWDLRSIFVRAKR